LTRKTQKEFLKKGGIKEAKWTFRVQGFITTYRLIFPTLYYYYEPIVPLTKGATTLS